VVGWCGCDERLFQWQRATQPYAARCHWLCFATKLPTVGLFVTHSQEIPGKLSRSIVPGSEAGVPINGPFS